MLSKICIDGSTERAGGFYLRILFSKKISQNFTVAAYLSFSTELAIIRHPTRFGCTAANMSANLRSRLCRPAYVLL
jgi:hypothetical protein